MMGTAGTSIWRRLFGNRDAPLLATLVVVVVVRSLLWIAAYPALKVADEPSHFDNIQYRGELGLHAPQPTGVQIDKVMNPGASVELRKAWKATNYFWRDRFLTFKRRVVDEKELEELALDRGNRLTNGMSTSYAYSGLYYSVGVIPYRMFRKASILTRLSAVRMYSMLWGLLLTLCTYLAARWTLESRSLAFAAGLFSTLQPMAAQQMIAINNDAAVFGLAALTFLLQLAVIRRLPDAPKMGMLIALGVCTGLTAEAKPHGIALLPGTALVLGWVLFAVPSDRRKWVGIASAVLAYVAVRALCPLLLDSALSPAAAITPRPETIPQEGPPLSPLGFLSFLNSLDDGYVNYMVSSTWGMFCWLDVTLRGEWFDDLRFAAPFLYAGGAAAVAQRLLRPQVKLFWDTRLTAFAAFTAAVGFFVVLFAEYFARETLKMPERTIQGRAFIIVLPAFAIIGAIAVGSLVPRRWRPLAALIATIGVIVLAAGALLSVVGHQYVG